MRAEPVTPELREEVLRLDGYRCVARLIAVQLGLNIDPCRNKWHATIITTGRYPASALEIDHVSDVLGFKKGMSVAGPMKGKRAPSDLKHLVSLCHHHHQDGWATSHRQELRAYLANRAGAPLWGALE